MSDTAYSGAHETAQIHRKFHSQDALDGMPDRIREIVLEEWDREAMPLEHLLRHHGHKAAHTRHRIWWRIRQTKNRRGLSPSFPQIGLWFGRDHTTIMLGSKAHERRMLSIQEEHS